MISHGARSLAAWDLASLIRTAKATGDVTYALGLATRIVQREADWKDTNPLHRFRSVRRPRGLRPGRQQRAFDYTLIGEAPCSGRSTICPGSSRRSMNTAPSCSRSRIRRALVGRRQPSSAPGLHHARARPRGGWRRGRRQPSDRRWRSTCHSSCRRAAGRRSLTPTLTDVEGHGDRSGNRPRHVHALQHPDESSTIAPSHRRSCRR